MVVDPADEQGFVAEALQLLARPDRRAPPGAPARDYAEAAFHPAAIPDAFHAVLVPAVDQKRRPTGIATR